LVALFLFYLQNVDAAPLEAVFDNVDVPQPIDRNGLLCNNIFEFAPNVFAIYLTRDLSVDYTFNIDENLPFFTQAWRDLLKMTSQISKEWKTVPTWAKITAGLVLLVVAAAINYYTAGIGGTAVSIWACLWPALVELTIGVGMAVVSWAINGLTTGNYSWQSLENAVADAVFFTGLFAFVSASVNALKGANRCTTQPKEQVECERDCFLAGTLVLCKDIEGNAIYKPIEEIKLGDLVWSFDEETGINDWKPVVHLFRNQATEWTEVVVDGVKTVSTPGHKYYLPETKTWCPAYQLAVGTKLLLSDGNFGVVVSVKDLLFDLPQTTYNFEVSEHHTYYVANGILVHNRCKLDPGKIGYTQESISKNFSNNKGLVDDLVIKLKEGSISPEDIPSIRVFKENGCVFSLDNRRLYAFKKAKMEYINVKWVNVNNPKIKRQLINKKARLAPGVEIKVRGGKK